MEQNILHVVMPQGIDLNRDAQALLSPEAKILSHIIDKIQPTFAFNLHDQARYYGTINSKKPTVLAFLAPAYNPQKTINAKRKVSMQLISDLHLKLRRITQQPIAKYNDDYLPTAFGDKIQTKKY